MGCCMIHIPIKTGFFMQMCSSKGCLLHQLCCPTRWRKKGDGDRGKNRAELVSSVECAVSERQHRW